MKLHHVWTEPISEFFKRIDECGGWPIGKKYVGFEHTDDRHAGFTDNVRCDGWWTTICSSDAYYLWKLSPEAKANWRQKIINDVARGLIGSMPHDDYYISK